MGTTKAHGGFVEGVEHVGAKVPTLRGGCCGGSAEDAGCCGQAPGAAADCCGESPAGSEEDARLSKDCCA
jgi:hypothetical protein